MLINHSNHVREIIQRVMVFQLPMTSANAGSVGSAFSPTYAITHFIFDPICLDCFCGFQNRGQVDIPSTPDGCNHYS